MGRRGTNRVGMDPDNPRRRLRRGVVVLGRLGDSPTLQLATKNTKGTKVRLDLLCLFVLLPGFYVIFFPSTQARVAQWIRAFASGAKGRRFDPCRG